MDYYDGNTVTALWNYAQNYAMSDNNWDTTFGPSTPGALNVISGTTGAPPRSTRRGTRPAQGPSASNARRESSRTARYGDVGPVLRRLLGQQPRHDRRPRRDERAEHRQPAEHHARHLGLVPGRLHADRHRRAHRRGLRLRAREHRRRRPDHDYSPHHKPFQYYASTANPHHLPPARCPRSATPTKPTTSTTCRPSPRPERHRRGQAARGQLPEGRRSTRTDTPATPTRSTSRPSWSTRSTRSSSPSTGRRPRSSSPTTTPTAGTTTRRRPVINGSNAGSAARPATHLVCTQVAGTRRRHQDRCGYGHDCRCW